uniref:Protein xylosyltransferase n=1 Tax=Coccolithus braarudii TaxID=221442 RepID=A0A7S0LET6_9EUKA
MPPVHFHVLVLGANRLKMLRATLLSVLYVLPMAETDLTIHADLPPNDARNIFFEDADPGRPPPAPLRSCYTISSGYHSIRATVISHQRHMGTRQMWLAALSISTPHLVLEDDVQLLPGADLWYAFAQRAFANDPRIVAASFQQQTLVNELSPKPSRRGSRSSPAAGVAPTELEEPWPLNTWKSPYLYPLPGSHGFLISPAHVKSFGSFVATHDKSALLIPGLTTTGWYKDFARQGKTGERMWTQEMVGYMYSQPHQELATLYPPRETAFAVHCATDHAKDEMASKCFNFKYDDHTQASAWTNWTNARTVGLPQLNGAARCLNASRARGACVARLGRAANLPSQGSVPKPKPINSQRATHASIRRAAKSRLRSLDRG